MDPEAVGEAISLAANQLVLRSTFSRTHGNSVGVHGSDATNAWRNIARATDQRTQSVVVLYRYRTFGVDRHFRRSE